MEATTEITNVGYEQRALEKAAVHPGRAYCAAPRSGQGSYRDYVIYSVRRDEVELEDPATGDGNG